MAKALRSRLEQQVIQNSEKWQQLTKEWSDSLKKARTRQAIIDDKMHSFLKGNGCLPTKEELEIVEQLWQQHVQAREKTNRFIEAVLNCYPVADEPVLEMVSPFIIRP